MLKQALVVIDIQNDYFPDGKYPLANTEQTLNNIIAAIKLAEQNNAAVIFVQHLADAEQAPFFNKGSKGAAIHPKLMAASPTSPVVIKTHADSFDQTELTHQLTVLGVGQILLCGMMTQNCITHTALSKAAEKYQPIVLSDCCASVDEMVHQIALKAIARRVTLMTAEQALSTRPCSIGTA
ncbi:cysteine hydrolase family protein [Motilimonas sp. E26]|uniref:cysteine hydrolase family protein n=1 Tax=Motilimonas sp. E26 TaxID=2865674 RepID=UPI001E55C089|nr:cysteine hydrolase family protein [Motilimonas sp. E26]MCE0559381.1 cysteine hydrolase [Motilimonas sp. E26]